MTKAMGRGVFANRFIKEGTLIIVEKGLIDTRSLKSFDESDTDQKANIEQRKKALVKQLSEIAKLKGIEALRMSYLYDGTDPEAIGIPSTDIFLDNHYK